MSLTSIFKALADPTRRRILQLLRERDLSAGAIAAHFAISKPSISHHLSLLKQAGLVHDERQGQQVIYSLNTTVLQEGLAWLMELGAYGGTAPTEDGASSLAVQPRTGEGGPPPPGGAGTVARPEPAAQRDQS